MLHRATYVLPLRSADPVPTELLTYLHGLAVRMPVLVVDGSEPDVFATNAHLLGPLVEHVAPQRRTSNGKVGSVVTGVVLARTPLVVVADDDVRYDGPGLAAVLDRMPGADAVMPQNYLDPRPWHASWDTGRSLLNRAVGHDWAGTVAVRRDAFLAAGCYCGDVLFENLELVRTLEAHGSRVRHAAEVLVARRPPSTRQFLQQRLRQAYDSHAQPARLAAELALLPTLLAARRSPAALAGAACLVVAVAEAGRRRSGGTSVWPPTAALWAVPWVLERSLTSWAALLSAVRGGARYRDGRLSVAAHRTAALARGAACRCSDHGLPAPLRPPTVHAGPSPSRRPAQPAAFR